MDLLNAHGIGGAPIRATSQLILTPGTQDIVKPNGNYTKGFKVPGEPNLVAANLVAGKSYFGVQGGATIESLGGKKFKEVEIDQSFASFSNFSISDLDFKPSIVAIKFSADNGVGSGDYIAVKFAYPQSAWECLAMLYHSSYGYLNSSNSGITIINNGFVFSSTGLPQINQYPIKIYSYTAIE